MRRSGGFDKAIEIIKSYSKTKDDTINDVARFFELFNSEGWDMKYALALMVILTETFPEAKMAEKEQYDS